MSINGTHSKVGQTHLWRALSLLRRINLSFQLAVTIRGDKSLGGVWQVMRPPDCHVKCVQSNRWSFIFTSSTLIAPYLLNLALDIWDSLRFLLLIFEPAVIAVACAPKTSRLNTASILIGDAVGFWKNDRVPVGNVRVPKTTSYWMEQSPVANSPQHSSSFGLTRNMQQIDFSRKTETNSGFGSVCCFLFAPSLPQQRFISQRKRKFGGDCISECGEERKKRLKQLRNSSHWSTLHRLRCPIQGSSHAGRDVEGFSNDQ